MSLAERVYEVNSDWWKDENYNVETIKAEIRDNPEGVIEWLLDELEAIR